MNKRLNQLELVRTYVYTGCYTPEMMNAFKRQCGVEIRNMNELIKQEDNLLKEINKSKIDGELKSKIEAHVNNSKEIFINIKDQKIKAIQDHNRRSEGQKGAFDYYSHQKFFQLRTTPLQARNSYINQKGVDVKLATDLIQLGYTNAFDIALILTGDTDLLESIKLIREKLGKIIILCSYYDEEDKKNSTISDSLFKEADAFINLKLLSDKEVESFSEEFKDKKDN
ncbi:NYN domain-containing protein [Candidatus Woesearchaeota archaeon]|nr:NYN domain-containing protein [Candidatus Woesearchaeota archaeon]